MNREQLEAYMEAALEVLKKKAPGVAFVILAEDEHHAGRILSMFLAFGLLLWMKTFLQRI